MGRMRRLTPPIEAFVRLQRSPRLSKAIDRTVGAYVALLSLMYPMLTKTTLGIFSCRDIDPVLDLSYLDILPTIECYGQEHSKLLTVGILSLFFYVLGIPFF